MDINKPWIIDRALSKKEKLALYICASFAGISVWQDTFDFVDEDRYPYTTYAEMENICGRTSLISSRQIVKYEEIMEELQKKVKENEPI